MSDDAPPLTTRPLSVWASDIAQAALATSVPERWIHVSAVMEKARQLEAAVGSDVELLLATAALHDLGHDPDRAKSGFAPLDGAWALRALDLPARIVSLVANIGGRAVEADLRGLAGAYGTFVDEGPTALRDGLWYACLTTGWDGRPCTLNRRTQRWSERFGEDEITMRWMGLVLDEQRAAIERTEARLQAASPPS